MWKRTCLALALAAAACKGSAKERAPEPAIQQPPDDARRADAAGRPLDVPIADVAVGAPLPRQPGGILVLDAAGRIATADVVPPWSGELPEQTRPLPEAELAQLWLEDQRGGSGTRLALEAEKLTPEKWRAARKRRAKARAIPPVESPPSRMVRATLSAQPGPDDDEDRSTPAIFASPAAPARLLARILVLRGGTLVVRANAAPRALAGRLAMYSRPSTPPGKPWIELHLDDRGVHVLLIRGQRAAGPGPFASKLVAWGELDRASLAAALAAHAGATGSPPELDLVVGDGLPVQRLVDVIGHVHALGVRAFGVAERAAAPDMRHVQELDRAWIKRTMGQHSDTITYCYELRLQERPDLAGTVTCSFQILPDGRTALVDAIGMDADVADCVALVLEDVRFPPFDQPAGISVRYPFTFRPAGAAGGP